MRQRSNAFGSPEEFDKRERESLSAPLRSRSGIFAGTRGRRPRHRGNKRIRHSQRVDMRAECFTAAIILQKYMRRRLNQKMFAVSQLPAASLTDYGVHPKGNDPDNMVRGFCDATAVGNDQQIAIVATSGLRVVELACKMTNPSSPIPKLFIVDNSADVNQFWWTVKESFKRSTTRENLLTMLEQSVYTLPSYTRDTGVFKPGTPHYEHMEVGSFLSELIGDVGFERVKSIIQSASPIRGSWEDIELFSKIKNISDTIGVQDIYAYPSNILDCICKCGCRDTVRKNIVISINKLKPKASLFTDLSDRTDCPETFSVLEGHVRLQDIDMSLEAARPSRDEEMARRLLISLISRFGPPPPGVVLQFPDDSGGVILMRVRN